MTYRTEQSLTKRNITKVNGQSIIHDIGSWSKYLATYLLRYFWNVQSLQIPVYIGASEGLVKKFEFPDNPFHGVNGFNGVLHDFGIDLNLQKESAALGLIEHTKNHPGEEAI